MLVSEIDKEMSHKEHKEGEIKIEVWNEHPIRFVFHKEEWWAVGADVANALGYENSRDALKKHCKGVAKRYIPTDGGRQQVSIIPKKDIYHLIFNSKLPAAEEFQDWVIEVIDKLRIGAGLKDYQVFRMLDKEQQKLAMQKLHDAFEKPVKVNYIIANIIADKAVSTMHGYGKLQKKLEMNETMLQEREQILTDVVDLIAVNNRLGLNLSVSEVIYRKYCPKDDNKVV